MAIEAQNGDYNLTSAVSVYSKVAAADGEWILEFVVGDNTKKLHADGGTLTRKITCGPAAQDAIVVNGTTQAITVAAANLRARFRSDPIFVASGDTLAATLLSSNANDTDVDVTVTPRLAWADARQISGSGPAADNLEALASAATIAGAVDDEAATTTVFITNLAEVTNNHYIGGVLVFTDGALAGQARRITDYDGATKTVTLQSALTEAPDDDDAFLILGRIQ